MAFGALTGAMKLSCANGARHHGDPACADVDGLFEVMDVKEYAARILGREADIMTCDSLHKTLRRQIEEAAARVF